jgi:hypothetical protein
VVLICVGLLPQVFLHSRVETYSDAKGEVVGSVRMNDRGGIKTVVEIAGYKPGMFLVYYDHREIKAGSTIEFKEVRINNELRRLSP